MSVEAFHRGRRAFFVPPDGDVVLLPAGDTRSHAEYAAAVRPDLMLHPRGYHVPGCLVVYQRRDDDDFAETFACRRAISRLLASSLPIMPDDAIEFGAIPGPPGLRWIARRIAGKVKDWPSPYTDEQKEKIVRLQARTGAGGAECRTALELRAWDVDCADEYIRRHNLAVVCTDAQRYPLWTARCAR